MRKIKMIGTALALPPYRLGEVVFVEELAAYTLASTGELQYVDPRDTVTVATRNMLLSAISRKNRQDYADATGQVQVLPAVLVDQLYIDDGSDPPAALRAAKVILPNVKPF